MGRDGMRRKRLTAEMFRFLVNQHRTPGTRYDRILSAIEDGMSQTEIMDRFRIDRTTLGVYEKILNNQLSLGGASGDSVLRDALKLFRSDQGGGGNDGAGQPDEGQPDEGQEETGYESARPPQGFRHRRKPIDDALLARVKELIMSGMTVNAVSVELRVSAERVEECVDMLGLHPVRKIKRELDDELIKDVRELYSHGTPISTIARELKIGRDKAMKALEIARAREKETGM